MKKLVIMIMLAICSIGAFAITLTITAIRIWE